MAGMSLGANEGFKDEPNVVPMIDVLLVLLIIFMMQVPLSRKVMQVQLPPEQQVQQEQMQEAQSNQIVMELREDGSYAINNTQYAKAELDAELHEIYDNRPAKLMFIKTHRSRPYADVIEAMDIARAAGVQVIGFTPPEEEGEEEAAASGG